MKAYNKKQASLLMYILVCHTVCVPYKWLSCLSFLLNQAEGANAAEEEVESEKSMSEVNDDEEGEEEGSDEVCFNLFGLGSLFCTIRFESSF